MAAFHGKTGKVYFNSNAAANVTSWSLDATADVVDTSVMNLTTVTAATHWKDYTATWNDWTASFECIVDSGGLDPDLNTDFALDGDGLAVELDEMVGGNKWTGNGIITGISSTVDKDDVARITYTIQGSGALSYGAI